ncbi:PdaC/SigV domain-containing protein [Clostridium magnum]|uniref:Anti-sigma-V factor RsiV n=1 Tax=Clostridium magnum DSM 2767 TaxID=1121326 RepID=A0A161WCY8_9CLOT|nr:DUF4163 domain-containing protein [Clostridium magnum]KZL89555.1 hypothetical protein CLMAG_50550 [Clostridium magnum DSM 2767]SHH72298.1 Protein of unknown function [Clostridium magnum DSM 2767]
MYYSEQYKFKSSTLKDNPLFNLILIAMNNNRFTSKKYKLMMNMTKDTNILNSVQHAYENELKHYNSFKQILGKLTGQSVEIPSPNIKINTSITEAIEDCIDKELEEIKLYQKIVVLISSDQIKTSIKNMITDKQRTAASLNFLYARGSFNRNPISSTDNNVSITFIPMKASKKYINEDLRIPVLSGIKNTRVQNKINDSLKDDILEFKRQMEDAADEDGLKAKKEEKKFMNYAISNNTTITYNKNNIISLSNLYHQFINGRTSYIRATYNFNIDTGISLGLKDLFKPGAPYRELINSEIRKQLIANKDIYPPEAAQNFKGIAEDHPFYLEGTNIVLFFGFNEIAPTISEIPVIKLPFKSFTGYIKPMFLS